MYFKKRCFYILSHYTVGFYFYSFFFQVYPLGVRPFVRGAIHRLMPLVIAD